MFETVLMQVVGSWSSVEGSVPVIAAIILAGVGTGVLFVISVLAYRQRRSRRYLLVVAAVGALCVRALVGLGTVLGVVPMLVHHLASHSLDFIIAALVLYAVIQSGPTQLSATDPGPDSD